MSLLIFLRRKKQETSLTINAIDRILLRINGGPLPRLDEIMENQVLDVTTGVEIEQFCGDQAELWTTRK